MAEFQFNFLSPILLRLSLMITILILQEFQEWTKYFFKHFLKLKCWWERLASSDWPQNQALLPHNLPRVITVRLGIRYNMWASKLHLSYPDSWVHDLACRILKFQDLTCKHWNFNIWHAEYYRFWPAEYWRYDMCNIPLSRSDMLFLSPCMFLCNDQWYGVRKW